MGHEWKFGDWLRKKDGRILRYVCPSAHEGGYVLLNSENKIETTWDWDLTLLPDCTGYDWQPIEPPEGYRLLERDERVQDGDMYLDKTSGWCIGDSVGSLTKKAAIAYARKLTPKYRPFASDKEASDFIGMTLIGNEKATWAEAGFNAVGGGMVLIGDERIPFKDAMERYSFVGGEPFGVKVE